MPEQITQTHIMQEFHSITLEDGTRKHNHVSLLQYSGEYTIFYVLTHRTQYSDNRADTLSDFLFRDGKEAMIRTVNLWNSVVMEKNYDPDAPTGDDFPF